MKDRNPVSEIYAGCFRRLVVQLYSVTGNLHEAQEVVQAFVRALAKPGWPAGLDNPEAWLRQVAVNRARSRYRRRRVLDGLLRRLGPPPDVPEVSPDHVALMAALRRLPVAQREAIALHYLADLPLDEIARTVGTTVGTVKSRLARGRAALAGHLVERVPALPVPMGVPDDH